MSSHDRLVLAVSKILVERRESLGLSQSDLSQRSGLHRSYIGDLERGFRNLAMKNLCRLAVALEMKPSKVVSLAEKRLAAKHSR
jgi:transcriptional regulator with XRE-family HTH domain